MKWILAILCGLALQAGAITNGVFATKSPYVVEAATMPFSLWTNSVLWITAGSPVLNAGTTNANWICYAKNCVGNATQTTVASQPTTITTNGLKSLYFDGGDFIYTPPINVYKDFRVSFYYTPTSVTSTYDIVGSYIASNNKRAWRVAQLSTGRIALFTSSDGISAQDAQSAVVFTNGTTHFVVITKIDTVASFFVDGVDRTVSALATSNIFSNGLGIAVGARIDGILGYTGSLSDIKITEIR